MIGGPASGFRRDYEDDDAMDMDKLVSLCKRRGFIFPSSEIYGGINGFWDYGPLGVELKRNIKDAWWRDNVQMRDDMVGLDCSIIMHPKVWEASGHVGGFSDPMVDCRRVQGAVPRRSDDGLWSFTDRSGPQGETNPRPLGFSAIGEREDVERENAKAIEKFKKLERSPGRFDRPRRHPARSTWRSPTSSTRSALARPARLEAR